MVQPYRQGTSFGDPVSDVPAIGAFAVTPSDSTTFSNTTATPLTRSLFVGTAGNVAVKMIDDTTVTFTNVLAGTILPICVKQVLLTGTTASDIIAVY